MFMPTPLANRPARPPHHSLADVARQLPGAVARGDATVSGISLNTRDVVAGDLFVAAPGSKTHGVHYAPDALAAGAVAVLTDEEGAARLAPGTPHVVSSEVRPALGGLSAWLYGHPAEAFTTIGITGTQGKTTTTHILAAAAGEKRSAVVGSMGTRIGGVPVASALTTPEAPQLHALFAVMREQGIAVATAEVSSHAILLGRVDGFRFDVGVFLNIGHDHRDYFTPTIAAQGGEVIAQIPIPPTESSFTRYLPQIPNDTEVLYHVMVGPAVLTFVKELGEFYGSTRPQIFGFIDSLEAVDLASPGLEFLDGTHFWEGIDRKSVV